MNEVYTIRTTEDKIVLLDKNKKALATIEPAPTCDKICIVSYIDSGILLKIAHAVFLYETGTDKFLNCLSTALFDL